jgi:hypothetical protein
MVQCDHCVIKVIEINEIKLYCQVECYSQQCMTLCQFLQNDWSDTSQSCKVCRILEKDPASHWYWSLHLVLDAAR